MKRMTKDKVKMNAVNKFFSLMKRSKKESVELACFSCKHVLEENFPVLFISTEDGDF